jgi:PTH1 family peptidyl-tRNA hydrolase
MTDPAGTRAIFGLGNPGLGYQFNRHNAGFLFLDHLLQDGRFRLLDRRAEHRSVVDWVAAPGGVRCALVRPQTFMNLSGLAFDDVLAANGWEPHQALLAHDDLDLPLGAFRLRRRGGSAGHRGVESVIRQAGTPLIPRLRIGVGPRPAGVDAVDFVLADFTAAERAGLESVFGRAADAVACLLTDGLTAAMNRHNVRGSAAGDGPETPAEPDAPLEN